MRSVGLKTLKNKLSEYVRLAFPVPVRTLDALHLASVEYLRAQRLDVRLATYDERMAAVARRLNIPELAL